MIVVCSTETSDTIRWSPNAIPLPCFAECGWGGWTDTRTGTELGPRRGAATVQIFKSVRLPVESAHSPFGHAVRGGASGVNAVPRVSELQTPSSRMFVINVEDDKYKLIETSSMSGPFSGPPSLSQERIHVVPANLSRINVEGYLSRDVPSSYSALLRQVKNEFGDLRIYFRFASTWLSVVIVALPCAYIWNFKSNMIEYLKALFNNVFTLKIWAACPYMLSVSLIKCENEALKKQTPHKHHCFKEVKIKKMTRFILLISPHTLLC